MVKNQRLFIAKIRLHNNYLNDWKSLSLILFICLFPLDITSKQFKINAISTRQKNIHHYFRKVSRLKLVAELAKIESRIKIAIFMYV